MIEEGFVFDAVRRGYSALNLSSNEEIIAYFAAVEPEDVLGHSNNIKGILFEEFYVADLLEQGVAASLFEMTNHPLTDIAFWEGDDIIAEFQMKATDSVSYVAATLLENPDIPIVVTSEVSEHFYTDMVVNSGIENSVLSEAVADTLFAETLNPFSAFALLRWAFGIPF